MKILVVTLLGLSIGVLTGAQGENSLRDAESKTPARSASDVVPLPSVKSLTPSQAAGKKLFVQRCSVCHLPALPSYVAYGPVLDGKTLADLGEQAVRGQIMRGSARMPGFQYTLSSAEIDETLDYLKTLAPPKPMEGK